MARVEIPAPADLVIDPFGNALLGYAVTLKLAGTGTNATHWSALTGGTSTTGGLFTSATGTIVNGSGVRRYVDSGVALDITINGLPRQVEPLSASVEDNVLARDVLVAAATGVAATDTAAILAAQAALPGAKGTIRLRPTGTGFYAVNAAFTLETGQSFVGAGNGEDHPSGFGYGDLRGVTTIKSSFNGAALTVAANAVGWELRDFTVTGDQTQSSQDLVKLLQTGPGKVTRVSALDSGRDSLVLAATLNVHFDACSFQRAKRHNLNTSGQANACKFTKCLFREANQWGANIGGGTDLHFDGCTLESNSQDSAANYGAMRLDPNDADASAYIHVTLTACHFENNKGLFGTFTGIPVKSLSGTRGCTFVETGSVYSETNACNFAHAGRVTSTGIQTNVGPHAILGASTNSTWIEPTKYGGGSFSVTDTNGYLATTVSQDLKGGRLIGARSPLVAGDFLLSAGWGSTRAVTSVNGTDSGYRIKVTCGGSGIGANPYIDLTFKDGAWPVAPIMVANMTGNHTGANAPLYTFSTTTIGEVTYLGTPVAGLTYEFNVMVRG